MLERTLRECEMREKLLVLSKRAKSACQQDWLFLHPPRISETGSDLKLSCMRNELSTFQGQKPEPDLAIKRSHDAIKFGDTADNRTLLTAGTVRFSNSHNSLQLCDGSAWLSLMTAGKSQVACKPGQHCLDILNSGDFRN